MKNREVLARIMLPLFPLCVTLWLVIIFWTNTFGYVLETSTFPERFATNFIFIGAGVVVILATLTRIWEFLEEVVK